MHVVTPPLYDEREGEVPMQLSYYLLIILLLSQSAQSFGQAIAYEPKRYEQFLTRTLTALKSRKKLIEQKLASSKAHQARALKKRVEILSPADTTHLQDITTANQAVIEELGMTQEAVARQIKTIKDEKNKLSKLTIKNKKEEDRLIRLSTLQLSIDDLQQQILRAQRSEKFFEKLMIGKTREERKPLTTLKRNVINKQSQLETKLRNEQLTLETLK